jgi:hypothetical protein
LIAVLLVRQAKRLPYNYVPMKPIPLLDYVGSPIFCTLFTLLLLLQWKYPLRRRHFSALPRTVRNFVMSGAGVRRSAPGPGADSIGPHLLGARP